jgi:CheY-like chemotaxis protein
MVGMRVVLCDEDALMRDVVEASITTAGHEVVGIADTTATAVHLIEAAHPDIVVLDLSLGWNTDFDIIESAIAAGARVVVFSRHADAERLAQYEVAPTVVPKPDVYALEQVLSRFEPSDEGGGAVAEDRRRRPVRAAVGPTPTGVSDAQAFFEAVNGAEPGDAMISIEGSIDAETVAAGIVPLLRTTDRLLAFPSALRFFLAGGGEDGVRSLLGRIADTGTIPPSSAVSSVVVREGEAGADGFDRLKHKADPQQLPSSAPTS